MVQEDAGYLRVSERTVTVVAATVAVASLVTLAVVASVEDAGTLATVVTLAL